MNNKPVNTLFELVHALRKHMYSVLDNVNSTLSPLHMQVVKVIGEGGSNTTAQVISFRLHKDKAQVTRLLNALLKASLIVKQDNPQDKRSHLLQLTAEGVRIYAQIMALDEQIYTRLREDFTEQELTLFAELTSRMTASLNRT